MKFLKVFSFVGGASSWLRSTSWELFGEADCNSGDCEWAAVAVTMPANTRMESARWEGADCNILRVRMHGAADYIAQGTNGRPVNRLVWDPRSQTTPASRPGAPCLFVSFPGSEALLLMAFQE